MYVVNIIDRTYKGQLLYVVNRDMTLLWCVDVVNKIDRILVESVDVYC